MTSLPEYDETNPALVAVVEALGLGKPNRYINDAVRVLRGSRPNDTEETR